MLRKLPEVRQLVSGSLGYYLSALYPPVHTVFEEAGAQDVRTPFLRPIKHLASRWALPRRSLGGIGWQEGARRTARCSCCYHPATPVCAPALRSVTAPFISPSQGSPPSSQPQSSCLPSPWVAAAACVDLWSAASPFWLFQPPITCEVNPIFTPLPWNASWGLLSWMHPNCYSPCQGKSQERNPQRRVWSQHGYALGLGCSMQPCLWKEEHGDPWHIGW